MLNAGYCFYFKLNFICYQMLYNAYALHIRMHTLILKHFISYYMTFLVKILKHIETNIYLSNKFLVLLGSFSITLQQILELASYLASLFSVICFTLSGQTRH